MSNKPVLPLPPQLSDLAACEKEIEAYLTRLSAQRTVEPEGCLPILSHERAEAAYDQWLKGLSLVPGDLKTSAKLNDLKPKYIPFWVVHSMTYTTYKGERGENHKETEGYQENGQHKTREVTKVRWEPASGEVRHHFERVTLCASSNLSAEQLKLVQPANAVSLDDSGPRGDAPVEKVTLDPKAAFSKARTTMEADIKKLVEKDIGGAQQKVTKVETRHVNVNMKLLLVPAYTGSYSYKGKNYSVFLNGSTGQVDGERPVSAGKVALVILIFLLIVAAIGAAFYFFLVKPNMQRAQKSAAPISREVREAYVLPGQNGPHNAPV